MVRGILIGLLAYAAFSCADSVVKGLGGKLPVFEIAFFATLFSLISLPFARPAGEQWRHILRMRRPGLVALRAASGTMAGILGVVAFTSLPLAEAYALIFLAPLFVTMLSIPFLGERVGWRRASAIVIGFAGILLVVRPGFRELLPGHWAAAGVALCGATTIIVLRALGPTEQRITLMGVALFATLIVSGTLMAFGFRVPQPADVVWLAVAGALGGAGHILLMAALRAAPATRIAPSQYTQIVWAMLLGSLFFGEFPDALALAGIALVCLAGLFTFAREEERGGRWPPVWTVVWGRAPPDGRD